MSRIYGYRVGESGETTVLIQRSIFVEEAGPSLSRGQVGGLDLEQGGLAGAVGRGGIVLGPQTGG